MHDNKTCNEECHMLRVQGGSSCIWLGVYSTVRCHSGVEDCLYMSFAKPNPHAHAHYWSVQRLLPHGVTTEEVGHDRIFM